MQVNHLLHVGKSQAEAFHIVAVSSMHAVELLEDFLLVFLLDTLSGVPDANADLVALVPCGNVHA